MTRPLLEYQLGRPASSTIISVLEAPSVMSVRRTGGEGGWAIIEAADRTLSPGMSADNPASGA